VHALAGRIIDGKAIAAKIRNEVKQEVKDLQERGLTPGLAVVLVGDDPASQIYVRMKEKACDETGIYSEKHVMPAETTQQALLAKIRELNEDDAIHGILVQLPLPGQLDESEVIHSISVQKDVDGFHPVNVGKVFAGEDGFAPCTPAGIMELIRSTGVDPTGKRAVVVGRSNIVGKPVAVLLLAANATVTICHSRTQNLAGECRNADILVAAVGRPEMIKGDWVKPGAVVIDVGINRTDSGLVGDVDFDEAISNAAHITPVPGGVGPMTIAMLMKNTVRAARMQAK